MPKYLASGCEKPSCEIATNPIQPKGLLDGKIVFTGIYSRPNLIIVTALTDHGTHNGVDEIFTFPLVRLRGPCILFRGQKITYTPNRTRDILNDLNKRDPVYHILRD